MENPTLSSNIGRHVCHTFSSRILQMCLCKAQWYKPIRDPTYVKLNGIRDQNNKNTVINKKTTHRALPNQTC